MQQTSDYSIKIAMVDDHSLLRKALAMVIDAFDGCRVILQACNGKELIESLQPDFLPDIVLLDVNMPEMDGYETAKWLQDTYPSICVLAMTMYDSDIVAIRLFRLGARGVLTKGIHPSELKRAMEMIMDTGFYYTGNTTKIFVHQLNQVDSKTPMANNVFLTANEMRFLELASTDMQYKEIAVHMKIATRSADNYRDSLFAKLSIRNRVGLAIYAIKNGIFGKEK